MTLEKDNKNVRIAFSGVSWATASERLKKGLPSPPEREQFKSEAGFEEAKAGWVNRVMPILALRHFRSKKNPSV